jgi:hypothetical protein
MDEFENVYNDDNTEVVIHDPIDPGIVYFRGTVSGAKEWWFKQLHGFKEIGEYTISTVDEYETDLVEETAWELEVEWEESEHDIRFRRRLWIWGIITIIALILYFIFISPLWTRLHQ